MMDQVMCVGLDDRMALREAVGDGSKAQGGAGCGVGAGRKGGGGRAGAMGGVGAVGEVDRREERVARSKLVETIKRHGWALAPRDLALLETVVVNNQPARPSCVMLGISESTGRHRVRMLTSHLKSFDFQFVAQHASKWSEQEAMVARCCVMGMMSIVAAAERLKLKASFVRRVRTTILARIDGARVVMHQFR